MILSFIRMKIDFVCCRFFFHAKCHLYSAIYLLITHARAYRSLLPNTDLGPSKLDLLSESVMDRTALNEDDDGDESQGTRALYVLLLHKTCCCRV